MADVVGEAEALVVATDSALTRFANNRIHQNVAESDVAVSVRVVLGQRQGVASTNRLDDEGLAEVCARASEAAAIAPTDPDFPGLPEPQPFSSIARASAVTRAFGPEARAIAARAIIEQSTERGLSAAGTVSATEQVVAIASTRGVDAATAVTTVRATCLATGVEGGSGWASFLGSDATRLAPEAIGDQAAELASRSERPVPLDPGAYTVVLAPEAVADILDFCGYLAFGAKAYHEKTSFVAGHEGEHVLSELLTVIDDAHDPDTIGLPFDYEGMPKERVPLIDHGTVGAVVTDSYWAAKLRRPNTGHALPAPNPYGPVPLNLQIAPGSATVDEMISSVKHGVYVTRFHYVNVEDPVHVLLTGMTRDGTFLIERGRLTRPLRNARFTQSMTEALSHIIAVGSRRELIGTEGSANLVPPLLLERFAFTGATG